MNHELWFSVYLCHKYGFIYELWIMNAEGVAGESREGLARRPEGESQRSGNYELIQKFSNLLSLG